jgi:hypothetical protein
MNARASFIRKLIYLGLIVALLVPLSLIGMPAKTNGEGGGMLAEMRLRNDISEASLGEIDPTSESVKLVMFGLRAPAITMLYSRINEQQKRKQWDDQRATLEELAKLQPHFCGVWRHQAWNLSYNISAEWDDYKQRYRCVKEGIKFLHEGTTKNRREARMIWDMGWFTGQKIGRSDEHREFRQIFSDPSDEMFEFLEARVPVDLPDARRGHRGRRDNWLMGKTWYLAGERMIDQGDADLIGMGDFQYFSSAPMSQFNYAEAIETEGIFGDVAKDAWDEGLSDFLLFGTRPMAVEPEVTVQLNNMEALRTRQEEALAALEALSPGLRQKIHDEKKDSLPAETKAALEVPYENRTDEQHQLAFGSMNVTYVTANEIAKRLPADKQAEGTKLAEQINTLTSEMDEIERLRSIVNYDYWRERGQLETREDALEARKLSYLADQAIEQGDLEQAKQHYDGALAQWKLVFAAHPKMAQDGTVGDDVAQLIRRYQSSVLDKLNEKLPEDPLYAQLLEQFPDN